MIMMMLKQLVFLCLCYTKLPEKCWRNTITQCCRNSSDLSDNRTFFQNVRQKMPVCRTKCPTKIFRPKKKIIELGSSEPAKIGGGLGKTKTNVKKSRFGGGTNSKQSKIRSKPYRAVIPTRLEIRPAMAGIRRWSNDSRNALAEQCDL